LTCKPVVEPHRAPIGRACERKEARLAGEPLHFVAAAQMAEDTLLTAPMKRL